MKDLLASAGAPEKDEHRKLAHALGGVGGRVYGDEGERLKTAMEAIEKTNSLAH